MGLTLTAGVARTSWPRSFATATATGRSTRRCETASPAPRWCRTGLQQDQAFRVIGCIRTLQHKAMGAPLVGDVQRVPVDVPAAELAGANDRLHEWLTYSHTFDGQRFVAPCRTTTTRLMEDPVGSISSSPWRTRSRRRRSWRSSGMFITGTPTSLRWSRKDRPDLAPFTGPPEKLAIRLREAQSRGNPRQQSSSSAVPDGFGLRLNALS